MCKSNEREMLNDAVAAFVAGGGSVKTVSASKRGMKRSDVKALCRGELTLDGWRRGERPKPLAAELY